MKAVIALSKLPFIVAVSFYLGCTGAPSESGRPALPFMQSDADMCARYGPAKVDILPITTLAPAPSSTRDFTVNAYVCLLDAFDSQIKAPATLRFELFQYVQRSAEPKGKRIVIWPDINISDPAVNNNHWQDFLRAYLFTLPLQKTSGDCILQVTCLCPYGKRLTTSFLIRSNR